jgi:hypothetical protein
MLHAPPAQPHPPEGILQFPCEQGDSSECVCTEGLNDENNFFIVFESHSGHVTSSCFAPDLCKTSNFVLHEEHLYSNTGITLIHYLFFLILNIINSADLNCLFSFISFPSLFYIRYIFKHFHTEF